MQINNEVVLWDRIVTRPEDARLSIVNSFAKYPIIDQRTELRGRLLRLSLHWDVMPYTGILQLASGGSYVGRLPDAYCVDDTCKMASDIAEEATASHSDL